MNKPATLVWSANSDKTLAKLDELLKARFELQETHNEACRYTILDDADWHIWHKGMTLVNDKPNSYRLLLDQQELSTSERSENPRFWWDFSSINFQRKLKKSLGLRALIPVTQLNFDITQYNLLNEDKKTVVRLETTSLLDNEHNPAFFLVSVAPLRGYQKEFKLACGLCESLSIQPETNTSLKRLMEAQGLIPPLVTTKTYGIKASQPTEEVIRKMLAQMFIEASRHEQGIIDDIDTEFLHDYRVSLRRTRSLLNLMKKCFSEQWQQQIKIKLSKLAQETNHLRDLDVFLLDRNRYTQMLPEQFASGLTQLFNHIQRQRDKAFKRVVTTLQSEAYTKSYNELQTLLQTPPTYETAQARKPVGKIVLKRIRGRYHKICMHGRGINSDTPDELVHELRIECKKLRYMFDFFKEILDRQSSEKLTSQLKKLQNILGNFNDYSVQQSFLQDRLQEEKSESITAAINGLIAILYQRQRDERSKVESAFAAFSSTKTASLFQQLTCTEEAT